MNGKRETVFNKAIKFIAVIAVMAVLSSCSAGKSAMKSEQSTKADSVTSESVTQKDIAENSDGFVVLSQAVPDVILEIRYYSTYNFVGERIDGYEEPCALITKEAAEALKNASKAALEKGYLTLLNMKTSKDVDMGGTFDYFGELSHPDYKGNLTDEQINNRNILRDIMTQSGFKPLDTEWWHFTLENEPYPDTYFNFPVSESSVESR